LAGADLCGAARSELQGSEERLRFEFELGVHDAELDLKALGARAAEQAERSLLQALIRQGARSSAYLAKRLSVDPKTLRLKLRRYGLEAELYGRQLGVPALTPTVPPKVTPR